MKKRLCMLLIAALLVLLVPHFASANSPARNPWEVRIYPEQGEEGAVITVYFAGDDGVFRQDETHRVTGERGESIGFYYRDGETQFYLVYTAPDGTETRSNTVGIVSYGKYAYDVGKNLLEERTSHYNTVRNCNLGGEIFLYLFGILLFPIGVTFLIEWLAALCFKIRPVRYVFAINGITNPTMNLLLLISTALLSYSRAAYWIMLAALEIAVVFIEYAYYTKKYPETKRSRLLLFSITANVLSLAVGGLAQYFIL